MKWFQKEFFLYIFIIFIVDKKGKKYFTLYNRSSQIHLRLLVAKKLGGTCNIFCHLRSHKYFGYQ